MRPWLLGWVSCLWMLAIISGCGQRNPSPKMPALSMVTFKPILPPDEGVAPVSTLEPTVTLPAMTLPVTGAVVNLRRGPGTHYDRVGQVHRGDQLQVTGHNTDASWLQISPMGCLCDIFDTHMHFRASSVE